MSLIAPAQSITGLTDTSDNESSEEEPDINVNSSMEYPGALLLIKWLEIHELLFVQAQLLKKQLTLTGLKSFVTSTNDQQYFKFINELKLKPFEKTKFESALQKLIQNQDDYKAGDTKSDAVTTLVVTNKKIGLNSPYTDDTMSITSGMTGISSILPAMLVHDLLVAMIGIGKYNDYPDLPGVAKDYESMIKTFVGKWRFKTLYKLDNNDIVYSNDINNVKTKSNYKLEWNVDEIEQFIEETRHNLVTKHHDGLLFILSSHGDTERVIYDSNCDKFELDYIFNMFTPEGSALLENYTETQGESNRLCRIPKIFFIDACR